MSNIEHIKFKNQTFIVHNIDNCPLLRINQLLFQIPDFNMANWVQSRILVSAQSARYELPMDMHVLSSMFYGVFMHLVS